MLNLKCFAFGSETMATLSCFENFAPECLANATKFGLNLWYCQLTVESFFNKAIKVFKFLFLIMHKYL